eukprot:221228-Prorocentrum_minimum.AAC.6
MTPRHITPEAFGRGEGWGLMALQGATSPSLCIAWGSGLRTRQILDYCMPWGGVSGPLSLSGEYEVLRERVWTPCQANMRFWGAGIIGV